MKTFLAIYVGGPASPSGAEWNKLNDSDRQARIASGMAAWGNWMSTHKAALVVEGGPLGRTKCVNASGVTDSKNDLTGYVVVRAESHEAAARMFERHPHFAIFPGESVEIMECLPIPSQS
jgi:hypothetical protein